MGGERGELIEQEGHDAAGYFQVAVLFFLFFFLYYVFIVTVQELACSASYCVKITLISKTK